MNAAVARDVIVGAAQSPLDELCYLIGYNRARANNWYADRYKASSRRRIRRTIRSVARKYDSAAAIARPAPAVFVADSFIGLSLGGVKNFLKDSLKKVRKVVGGALKFVPQAKVINCGLAAAIGAGTSYLAGANLREILVSAGGACLSTVIKVPD